MNKIALIKAEIKRLYDGEAPKHDQQCDFDDGYFTGIGAISKFLDTLSEEPDKSLEEAAVDFVWDIMENDYYGPSELSKRLRPTSKLDDFYGALAEIFIAGAKWQAEQFEKNRLAACEKQTKEEYDREMEFAASIIEKEHRQPTFSDAINYGIEWQKKQIPMPEDTVIFNKGVAEGKRLMLEGAVEKTVGQLERQCGGNFHFMHGFEVDEMDFPFLNSQECGYGDKVRIIIVKED